MTETAIVVLALVIIAFVVVLWRMTAALVAMSGTRARSNDRERRDHYQIIERLLEKRDATNGFDMAQMHSRERVEQMKIDACMEQTATEQPKPKAEKENPYCTVEEYEQSENG